MQSSLTNKFQKGFTLIEILVIAPVVILVISGFVALMITIVGDVLVSRDQSNMSYEIQDGLDRIEQDIRLTTQFLVTSGTQVAPQGSDSGFAGTAAFTSTNSLVMGGLATDKNPTDNTRKLIFYAKQPNDCGTQEIYNRVFQSKIIYFIKDGSLWRRTILPNYNTNASPNDDTVCAAPWQQNSCSPGYSLATRCQTNDIEITKNVKTFTVKYLSSAGSTTDLGAAQALSANAIEVQINGEKTTAGRTVASSGNIRGTKLNSLDVSIPIPGAPLVSSQLNGASATFTWTTVPTANSYQLSYNINGGAWQDVSVNSQTLSYTVNAGQGNTVTMRVAAINTTGTSAYTTNTITIPLWYVPALLSNWKVYDSTPPGNGGYSTPAYTKTSADVVVLKGVIKDGSTGLDTTFMKLPVGYRPTHRLVFQTDSVGGPSRIDILPNGDVRIISAGSPWLILDGIRFVASTAPYTWTNHTFQNGWNNYATLLGGDWAPLSSTLDSQGRVHTKGLARGGANTNPTDITTALPAAHRSITMHIPAATNGFGEMAINTYIQSKGIPNSTDYLSTQSMYYPTGTGGWTDLALQNGWVNLDTANFTSAQYKKGADNIVAIKGLIRGGNTAGGTTIAQLPPGYRPKERLCLTIVAVESHARVDVLPDGLIIVVYGTNSGWTSLDNISFIAEQ